MKLRSLEVNILPVGSQLIWVLRIIVYTSENHIGAVSLLMLVGLKLVFFAQSFWVVWVFGARSGICARDTFIKKCYKL